MARRSAAQHSNDVFAWRMQRHFMNRRIASVSETTSKTHGYRTLPKNEIAWTQVNK